MSEVPVASGCNPSCPLPLAMPILLSTLSSMGESINELRKSQEASNQRIQDKIDDTNDKIGETNQRTARIETLIEEIRKQNELRYEELKDKLVGEQGLEPRVDSLETDRDVKAGESSTKTFMMRYVVPPTLTALPILGSVWWYLQNRILPHIGH